MIAYSEYLFIYIFKDLFYFELCVHGCLCVPMPIQARGIRCPWSWSQMQLGTIRCGCYKLNLGALQEL